MWNSKTFTGAMPRLQLTGAFTLIIVSVILLITGPKQRIAFVILGSRQQNESWLHAQAAGALNERRLYRAILISVDSGVMNGGDTAQIPQWSSSPQYDTRRANAVSAIESAINAFKEVGKIRLRAERAFGITPRLVLFAGTNANIPAETLELASLQLSELNVVVDVVTDTEPKATNPGIHISFDPPSLSAGASLKGQVGASIHISGLARSVQHYRCDLDANTSAASDSSSSDSTTLSWGAFSPDPVPLSYGFHLLECKFESPPATVREYVKAEYANVHLVHGPTNTLAPIEAELTDLFYDENKYIDGILGQDSAIITPKVLIIDGVSESFWQRASAGVRQLVERGVQLYVSGPPTLEEARRTGVDWLPGFSMSSPSGRPWRHRVRRDVHFVKDLSPLGEIGFAPGPEHTCELDSQDASRRCTQILSGRALQDQVIANLKLPSGRAPLITGVPISSANTVDRLVAYSVNRRLKPLLNEPADDLSIAPVGELIVLFAYDLPQPDCTAAKMSDWVAFREQGRQVLLVTISNPLTSTIQTESGWCSLTDWIRLAESELQNKMAKTVTAPLSAEELNKAITLFQVSPIGANATAVDEMILKTLGTELVRGVGVEGTYLQGLLLGRLGPISSRAAPDEISFVLRRDDWVGEYDHWITSDPSGYLKARSTTVGSVEGLATVVVSGEGLGNKERLKAFIRASSLQTTFPPNVQLISVRSLSGNEIEFTAQFPEISGVRGIGETLHLMSCSSPGWQENCVPAGQVHADVSAILEAIKLSARTGRYKLTSGEVQRACHDASYCVLALADSPSSRFLYAPSPTTSEVTPSRNADTSFQPIVAMTGGRLSTEFSMNRFDSRRIGTIEKSLVLLILAGLSIRLSTRVVSRPRRGNQTSESLAGSFDFSGTHVVSPSGLTEPAWHGNPSAVKPLESGDTLRDLTVGTILAWKKGLRVLPQLLVREALFSIPIRIHLQLEIQSKGFESSPKMAAAVFLTGAMASYALKMGREVWLSVGKHMVRLQRFEGDQELTIQISQLLGRANDSATASEVPIEGSDVILVSDFLGDPRAIPTWLDQLRQNNDRFLLAIRITDSHDWKGGTFVFDGKSVFDRTGWLPIDSEVFKKRHEAQSKALVTGVGATQVIIAVDDPPIEWIRSLSSNGVFARIEG
jgi:hypothetical protein